MLEHMLEHRKAKTSESIGQHRKMAARLEIRKSLMAIENSQQAQGFFAQWPPGRKHDAAVG